MSNRNTSYEESQGRLKVVIPVRVNWLLLAIYSAFLIVWLAMLIVVLVYILQGMSSSIVLTILLLIWVLIWLVLGRFLWNRWQFQAAHREILYIDSEQLIIRRPVSILGLTTTYDRDHVSPFYYSYKHGCPAFDYAYLHVYFGHDLSAYRAHDLIASLNARFFPNLEEE